MTEIKSAYWDKETLVKEVQSGENRIRISVCEKKGNTWLAIREWYKTVTGEYAPGKHGLAIRVEGPETIDEIIGAVTLSKECLQ